MRWQSSFCGWGRGGGEGQAAEGQVEGELREEAVTTVERMGLFCLF